MTRQTSQYWQTVLPVRLDPRCRTIFPVIWPVLLGVNQATGEVYRPPDRGLGALFCQLLGVPTGRWISLPWGPTGAYIASSLGASFILLLYALLKQHVRTFHGVSRGSGGCWLPSGFGCLGINPRPPPVPFP